MLAGDGDAWLQQRSPLQADKNHLHHRLARHWRWPICLAIYLAVVVVPGSIGALWPGLSLAMIVVSLACYGGLLLLISAGRVAAGVTVSAAARSGAPGRRRGPLRPLTARVDQPRYAPATPSGQSLAAGAAQTRPAFATDRPDPMKTYSATPKDIERGWYLIDADGLVLGPARGAGRDRGCAASTRPCSRRNLDCGDHVVVVNAEKVALTGNKLGQKTYYRHTGYPGGIKQRTAQQILEGAHPERVIEKAVERMLPKGALGRQQLKKLHVYRGPEHPHQGQTPTALDVAARNRKNSVKELADG